MSLFLWGLFWGAGVLQWWCINALWNKFIVKDWCSIGFYQCLFFSEKKKNCDGKDGDLTSLLHKAMLFIVWYKRGKLEYPFDCQPGTVSH